MRTPYCSSMRKETHNKLLAMPSQQSSLGQVFSRERTSSRCGPSFGVLLARRTSPYSSPESPGGGLHRALVDSRRGVLFVCISYV